MSLKMKNVNFTKIMITILLSFVITLQGCAIADDIFAQSVSEQSDISSSQEIDIGEIPEFSGEPFVRIANNSPDLSEEEISQKSFEIYSERDDLGRCGEALACIGIDLMPTEDRGSISSVKPSGWQSSKYDIVSGGYLYNRCHLIGFQLSGENANERNLITGTRSLNIDGMLPFENMIADYVKETDNHVMYRVVPLFDDKNLVANGVWLQAYSVEDEGEGISFNVYAYNNQQGITIDYLTGKSALNGEEIIKEDDEQGEITYILNTNTKKFHKPDCGSAKSISDGNKDTFTGTKEELIILGYEPCGVCKP